MVVIGAGSHARSDTVVALDMDGRMSARSHASATSMSGVITWGLGAARDGGGTDVHPQVSTCALCANRTALRDDRDRSRPQRAGRGNDEC